jgi:hypothetical protein
VEGRTPDCARHRARCPVLVAQSEAAFVARAGQIEAGENEARQRITGMRADIAALDEQLPAVQHQLAVARDATHTIALLVDRDLAPCPRLVDRVALTLPPEIRPF